MNIVSDYQENYGSGWVKMYRSLEKHWIINNAEYFRAWFLILCNVNHAANKVLIGSDLVECKRGESLKSIKSWNKVFGPSWTRQKIRTFFNLLENDSMINHQATSKTTKLTVCNYDTYQSAQPSNNQRPNHQITIKQPDDNHEQEYNNLKNDKKKENTLPKDFLEFWNLYHKIARKLKEDRALALKYWEKLSAAEKELAMKNIKPFCNSASEPRYISKAWKYLIDKKFNNEFEDLDENGEVIPEWKKSLQIIPKVAQ